MRAGRRFSWTAAAAVAVVGVVFASQAVAATTVTNGSFETGDFTGWTVIPQADSSGNWTVTTGTSSPIDQVTIPLRRPRPTRRSSTRPVRARPSCTRTSRSSAGRATRTLTFTHWYANDATEGGEDVVGTKRSLDDTPLWASPPTLDFTTDVDNQQYRVDIMKPTADLASVASADVLKSVFQTEPGDPATLDPTGVTVDLSAFAGQTVRLRFAAVDNDFYLRVGVDCLALASTPISTTTTSSTTPRLRPPPPRPLRWPCRQSPPSPAERAAPGSLRRSSARLPPRPAGLTSPPWCWWPPSARSGTTLLGSLLDLHPAVVFAVSSTAGKASAWRQGPAADAVRPTPNAPVLVRHPRDAQLRRRPGGGGPVGHRGGDRSARRPRVRRPAMVLRALSGRPTADQRRYVAYLDQLYRDLAADRDATVVVDTSKLNLVDLVLLRLLSTLPTRVVHLHRRSSRRRVLPVGRRP